MGTTAVSAFAASYSITDLGNLGYPTARAAAINESGQVAGTSYLAERVEYNVGCPIKRRPCFVHPEHPFLWSEGKMTDLGTLGGLFAVGSAIKSAGDVAGMSYLKGNGQRNAFLVHNGHMSDLGALVSGGASSSAPLALAGVSSWLGEFLRRPVVDEGSDNGGRGGIEASAVANGARTFGGVRR